MGKNCCKNTTIITLLVEILMKYGNLTSTSDIPTTFIINN